MPATFAPTLCRRPAMSASVRLPRLYGEGLDGGDVLADDLAMSVDTVKDRVCVAARGHDAKLSEAGLLQHAGQIVSRINVAMTVPVKDEIDRIGHARIGVIDIFSEP